MIQHTSNQNNTTIKTFPQTHTKNQKFKTLLPLFNTYSLKFPKPPYCKKTIMSAHGKAFSLLFLFILVTVITPNQASTMTQANGSVAMEPKSEEMVPLMEEKMVMMLNETRRKLNSFQICALCTCCGGAKGLCLPSPCCYAINCNIPNRPFGFCSFTPKTCNCLGCHL